jgi:hypothetical protein
MHKLVLLASWNLWRCGEEILLLTHKCKKRFPATSCSLDPTSLNTPSYVDDDTATVITSNPRKQLTAPTSMAATAQALFGNPMPQYSNTLTILTNQAIADTGATFIFIMEGTDVDNKRIALSPLPINLQDGKRYSLRMCVTLIPGASQWYWLDLLSRHWQLHPSLGYGPFAKQVAMLYSTMRSLMLFVMVK